MYQAHNCPSQALLQTKGHKDSYAWLFIQQTSAQDHIQEDLVGSDDVVQVSSLANLSKQFIPRAL